MVALVGVAAFVRWRVERERRWRRRLEEDPVYLAGLSLKMRRERQKAEERMEEQKEEERYETLPGEA